MFRTKSNVNVTIFNRNHSIGNGIEKYTLALGPDLAGLVDYIIKENDLNDQDQQQQLIDELIRDGIEALVKATQDTIDVQYINFLCTLSRYSVEKKRSHLLNYEIDRETLRWCDYWKSTLYDWIENEENEFISYQKIFMNERDIIAFTIELDDDLQKKIEYAKEVMKAYDDLNESELLELAIVNSIEQRYVKTVNAPAKHEDTEDFKVLEYHMFKNKRVIPISIYQRDHKVGNGIDNYMLALGTDLGAQVDYIIKQENLNYEEQQQLLDQMILDGIDALFEATKDRIEDYYEEYINHAFSRFQYKLSHFLNYEIDKMILSYCDLEKKSCYRRFGNSKTKSNIYQKICIDQKDIVAFKVDLSKDFKKKLKRARDVTYSYGKIEEVELLEHAIILGIEQRYIETLKLMNEYVEQDFNYVTS
jgi:hypothetical protein